MVYLGLAVSNEDKVLSSRDHPYFQSKAHTEAWEGLRRGLLQTELGLPGRR